MSKRDKKVLFVMALLFLAGGCLAGLRGVGVVAILIGIAQCV